MKPGEMSAEEDEEVTGGIEVEETGEEEVGEEHRSDRDSEEEEPQAGDSVEKNEDIQQKEVRKIKTGRIEPELYSHRKR